MLFLIIAISFTRIHSKPLLRHLNYDNFVFNTSQRVISNSGCSSSDIDGYYPPSSTAFIYPSIPVIPFYQWQGMIYIS